MLTSGQLSGQPPAGVRLAALRVGFLPPICGLVIPSYTQNNLWGCPRAPCWCTSLQSQTGWCYQAHQAGAFAARACVCVGVANPNPPLRVPLWLSIASCAAQVVDLSTIPLMPASNTKHYANEQKSYNKCSQMLATRTKTAIMHLHTQR